MRHYLIMTLIVGLTAGASPALAQMYPVEEMILQDGVEVRSGPSKQFMPTSKLPRGYKVIVLRESKAAPGWLEIKPPAGSFSWINARYVKQFPPSQFGYVDADPTRPAPVQPGSSLVNQAPTNEIIKLTAGTIVVIMTDKIQNLQGDVWLPILVHPSEVRYIPKESVQPALAVAPTSSGPPNWTLMSSGYTKNPAIAEAENAISTGDYNRARQLLTQIQNTSPDNGERAYAANRLSQPPLAGAYTAAQPVSTARGGAPFTVMSSPGVAATPKLMQTAAPAWSAYGRLRETTVKLETGQTVYVLEDTQGKALSYVTIEAGKSLQQYVGRMVAVYGPTVYQPESAVRLNYMVASYVSIP